MIRTIGLVIFGTGLAMASSAQAQQVYHFPAPENAAVGAQRYVLPTGTPLKLRTTTQISSKTSRPGDRLHLEVAQPVMFRDQVVIPAGSPVTAEVTTTDRNGHFGRRGRIEFRLIDVITPHGPVSLAGASYDNGKSGTAASIGTILFVTSLGFLIHGTSGYIPAGTIVDGQLNDDLRFRYSRTVAYGGANVASGAGR